MADQRKRFPQGNQPSFGGFNQMPANAQFQMMQQQQFPMMQQGGMPMMQQCGMPMMQQGPNPMMQQQQQRMMMQGGQMFPGQPNQGQFVPAGGGFGGGPTGTTQGGMVYNPQMAKELKAKQEKMMAQQQKIMEEQRKRMEKAIKDRQFQDQQKRLKEFTAIGGRKMDVDSFMKSIVGDPDPRRQQVQPPPGGAMQPGHVAAGAAQPAPVAGAPQTEDDFGDFLSVSASAAQPAQPVQPVAPNQKLVTSAAGPKAIVTEPPAPAPKEEKKDLTSFMMQCSDLSAPKAAKGFVKPSVKEVQPKRGKTITYQASQKARTWTTDTEKLSEIFTLPQPEPEAPILPKWITGQAPAPEVYHQVHEACTRDDKIQTELLYPILLRSGLARETLGQLWAMANEQTPGQLVKEELFALLALIAVIQNKMQFTSIDVLNKCPLAPIPNLGQNQTPPGQPLPSDTQHQEQQQQQQQYPQQPPQQQVNNIAPASIVGINPAAVSSGAVTAPAADDDFADFQAAGPSAVPASNSFGDFSSAAAPPPPAGLPTQMAPVRPAPQTDLIGEEDKYSMIRMTAQMDSTTNNETEEFADFQGFGAESGSTTSPPTTLPTSASFGDFSSPVEPVAPSANQTGFADFSSASQGGSVTSTGEAEFAAFLKASNSSSSQAAVQAPQQDNFAGFQAASGASDGFADFQAASSSMGSENKVPPINDKLNVLKALVSDKNLYTAKPKEEKYENKDEQKEEEEWADFAGSKEPENKYDAFKSETPSSVFSSSTNKDEKLLAWGGSGEPNSGIQSKSEVNDSEEGWADFSSAPMPAVPSEGTSIDWSGVIKSVPKVESENELPSSSPPMVPSQKSTITKGTISKPKELNTKDKNRPGKRYDYFGRSLAPSNSLGIAALDTAPPDFPPDDDFDDGDDFDKFGTFQANEHVGGGQSGVSSLVTPYGGLEDFGESNNISSQSYASKRTVGMSSADLGYSLKSKMSNLESMKDNIDALSTSSSEFSGWKAKQDTAKEDSQSIASLELNKKGSKDGSPMGGDSQSVSSLDMGTSDSGRKSATPLDARSINSLDFKSPEDPQAAGEESFGEFNAANSENNTNSVNNSGGFITTPTENKELRPREASEVMVSGPVIGGDRYSEFTKRSVSQDGDAHITDWQQCLEQCLRMITDAYKTFKSISSQSVVNEVVSSQQGRQYLIGIVEIYKVVRRITASMKAFSVSNGKLTRVVEDINVAWNNITPFITNSDIMPNPALLNFSLCAIGKDEPNSLEKACGICLLNVSPPNAGTEFGHKLTYGARQYHSSCANFWVNCVDCTLPTLKIPELL